MSLRVLWRYRGSVAFIVLIGVLCLQFAVSRFSEPYPAILMPPFGGAPPHSGITGVSRYEVEATSASGEVASFDARDFFDDLKRDQVGPELEFILSQPEDLISDSIFHLDFLDRMLQSNRRSMEEHRDAFERWLSKRLVELTGKDGWTSLRIDHVALSYDLDNLRFTGARRITETSEFDLP